MFTSARARLFVLPGLLLALAASCAEPQPPGPPPAPWLVEVASVEGEAGAGLKRCAQSSCEAIAEQAVLGAGTTLRADRGARVTLALDAVTSLSFRDGAEIEIAEGTARTIRVKHGAAAIERREDIPGAVEPVVVEAAGRGLVVRDGPLTAEVSAAGEKEPARVLVQRGRAALRAENGDRALATGEGARWVEGGAIEPLVRWMTFDHEEDAVPPPGGSARGLGMMTARVPGTNEIVSGVRLAMHHVSAEVADGFARTVVEEEFENETPRTLEGRFVFPLPPDASISRLALFVGDELVEGEVVEKPLASRIFKAIVDDTVRPRDPAILEQTSGSTVSLKIFPIPPKGKRRVILAYDQALAEEGDEVRYVYPLSLGSDRATPVDDFAVSVVVKDSAAALGSAMTAGYEASLRADEQGIAASYSAKRFAPTKDFVLRYTRAEGEAASLSWSAGPRQTVAGDKAAPAGYFAVRLRTSVEAGAVARMPARAGRVFVIDASHSQSAETLDASIRVVKAGLQNLDPEARFAVLACDSACNSYPEDGLARAGDDELSLAVAWMAKRAPGGSSDLAGSLIDAATRLSAEGGGQIVYLGDGVATSGEIGLPAIASRIQPRLHGIDAHFVGVGPSVDEAALSALASSVSGTYERLATGATLASRAAEVARAIDAPILRDAQLVLPEGAFDVLPTELPPLRLGQELLVYGRFRPDLPSSNGDTVPAVLRPEGASSIEHGPLHEVRLRGEVDGAQYELVRSLDWDRALSAPSPAIAAMWARSKIRELEIDGGDDATKEIVRLSTVHHVLSRATALLVLENERMFAETGVRAAIDRVLASEPQGPAPSGSVAVKRRTDPDAPSQPWGMMGQLASDPAKGNLWGDSIGSSFGAGGLGLSGVGEGGGGRGEGIGLGSIGTIGHAAGTGTGVGFGSGSGRLSGSHASMPLKVRAGATSVSGRLPPEVIQRIVRQNFGRFRLCYENGLRNNPNLQGRVAVRFVIDRTGATTSIGNGGSDLPDAGVVSCVVRAFSGLRFPEPEAGIVTVVFPISFARDEGSASSSWRSPQTSWPRWAPNPPLDAPVVTHRSPEEAVTKTDDGAIAKLLAQLADPAAPRSAHQSLVKKLLAAGRFDDAFTAASRYRGIDPDHEVALELYAQAAAATGRVDAALSAVDAQVEADPTKVATHRRAAAAFEAAGDERRACAHFRALASLPSADDAAAYHALRCRARLGERTASLAQARGIAKPGPLVTKLIAALESGSAPPYDPGPQSGSFEVRVTCTGEASECPVPVVVGPSGLVLSPWTPGLPYSRSALAFTAVTSGTYRTILTGEVPPTGADVTVRVLGQTKALKIMEPGTHVALASNVQMPSFGF